MSWKSKDLSRLLIRLKLKSSNGLSRPSSRPKEKQRKGTKKLRENKKKPKENQEQPREKSKTRQIQGNSCLLSSF